MKKLFAIFLVLAMLVPMGLVAQAETVTTKPFYLVNWSSPEGDPKYIYSMPGSWVNESKVGTGTTADNAPVSISSSGTSVKEAAQKMYDVLKNHPAGTRYFNFASQRTLFLARCKDLVDMRHGVELTKNWVTALLTEYKALGGELDGIILDLEYNDATVYYMNANYYSNKSKPNKEIYNQIAANEYYQTVLRPKLVERGFVFYTNPDPVKYPYRSELWTLEDCSEEGANSTSRSIWNQLMQEEQATAMTKAVYEPLIQFYPNAVVSDYKTGDSYSWFKGMGHTGSQSGYNGIKAGNASNYNFYDYATGYLFYGYGSESNRTKRTKYQKPASYNDAVFADAPFSRTNWEINTMKRLLASTDTGKVNAWITFYNYGTYGPGYSRTAYYSELIYHLGMTNPEPFIGYILKNEVISKGYYDPDPNACEYDYNLKVVDDLMAELTRVAGASDRKAIVTPITWNENFILSGMYAGGRNIWRLTPNTDEISKADFKVKDYAPTFTVNGVTITFPQGRIIEDSAVTQVGTCGYWIETPANVTPVITSNANRYANDPSFSDNFDAYADGAFTATSVLPNTYWTISGTANIQTSGSGKVLALSDNGSVTNTKVPNLITAGDYYAKQQAWEVTVTLPSGDYGDVKLLSTGSTDGGVKISGGKVYYDQSGAYQELTGVTLAAGTYTVKRELDFRTEGAYTCSYTIYDASGKRLGGTAAVPSAIATIPVTSISISVSGAKSAVLIDDYKLYPTGLTTNLDLYDARYGRKLADANAAQTQDVGYRLSWMNASNQYKVARIYDVKSGTILKKIDMAPGMDGIVTGIAQSGGKAIQVAIDVQDATAPTQPNYDNGKFGWTATAESLGLATGHKPAGNDPVESEPDTPDTTPDNGAGEEGGNIYEDGIVEGTPETTPPADSGSTPATDPVSPGTTGTQETPAEEKDKTGTIVLIAVLAVVVIGGGIAAWLFLKSKKKKA